MIGTIILSVWGVGFLVLLRPVFGRVRAFADQGAEPDEMDYMFMTLAAMTFSAIWPIALVLAALFRWMRGSKYNAPTVVESEPVKYDPPLYGGDTSGGYYDWRR